MAHSSPYCKTRTLIRLPFPCVLVYFGGLLVARGTRVYIPRRGKEVARISQPPVAIAVVVYRVVLREGGQDCVIKRVERRT